jgi:hypothetical protein
MEMKHISTMTPCIGAGKVNAGESWKVRAYYNYTDHPGMVSSTGKPAKVMGITIMWVALPLDQPADIADQS